MISVISAWSRQVFNGKNRTKEFHWQRVPMKAHALVFILRWRNMGPSKMTSYHVKLVKADFLLLSSSIFFDDKEKLIKFLYDMIDDVPLFPFCLLPKVECVCSKKKPANATTQHNRISRALAWRVWRNKE